MGTVWRAADTVLRREVAVKEVILPPGMAVTDAEAMFERTHREARAAAALSHPSVVQVFDVIIEDGRPWIVMELLDARSLADMVIEDGPLAPRAVAKIGIALLGALEVAHAAGVLHRDVKPANVLITRDGRCVLTDFGVAKLPSDVQLTTPGMVLGSPHFISPERALGHRFGPPSDLFSLGVTLYTAVEGRPPFDKGDPLATMHSVVEDPPLPPQRCGPLADVLYGLMEKDPNYRWDVPSARGFLREMLAGPLAQSPNPQHVTDPWAVVAPQPAPPPVYDNRPTGQIGGRAMLHTGESPTHRTSRHATSSMPSYRPRAKRKNGQLRLAIAAGVFLVLAAATVSWAVLGRDRTPQAEPTLPPSTPSVAALETRSISFGGITVKMPATWKQAPQEGTYVDIEEPTDSDRWLRLNNVNGESNSRNALQSAENNILKKTCDGGYQRLSLGEAQLGGAKGAELEFTCTPKGKPQRHGIWRIAVIAGKSRHLYLNTWESTWDKDKAVFDAALASFTVTQP
jgi:serine/threonine protein kinase